MSATLNNTYLNPQIIFTRKVKIHLVYSSVTHSNKTEEEEEEEKNMVKFSLESNTIQSIISCVSLSVNNAPIIISTCNERFIY